MTMHITKPERALLRRILHMGGTAPKLQKSPERTTMDRYGYIQRAPKKNGTKRFGPADAPWSLTAAGVIEAMKPDPE
jgi:hypothetical protein